MRKANGMNGMRRDEFDRKACNRLNRSGFTMVGDPSMGTGAMG